ncbi:hypothetical protein V5O48_008392 [Marasmius crinis-equi]|uniref:Uncharacterized protein n=1 Tax=Marasmius crinis-equi TaxID=585013 RepID=A0ABR3FE61_9AGAR
MAPPREPCNNFESDEDNSDADRSNVACKHCDLHRENHPTSAAGPSNKRRRGGVGVRGVFNGLLAGKSDNEAEQLLKSANNEAKNGLKSKNKGNKPKSSKKTNGKTRSPKVYRLGTLFMDVSGTYKTTVDGAKVLNPKSTVIPSRGTILEATQRGHAAEFRKGLEIPDDASFEDINELIREHLPKPFDYFDKVWDQDYPPFVFASVEHRRLALCQHLLRPNGHEIRSISQGSSGKGFESNRLFIVTRKPIPQDILTSWSPSTIADVDDNEEESSSDKACSEAEDMEASDESDNQRDREAQVGNNKGKGKAVDVVRRYRRKVIESDAEGSETNTDAAETDESISELRPKKKARIDLTKDDDSDGFKLSMAEYNAAANSPDSSSLFLPGTPLSKPSQSTVNPQFSDPRPENDPYTNLPDLDFL